MDRSEVYTSDPSMVISDCLWCSPNFNKLSYQLRIGNIFYASWECYQRNEMTINRVSRKTTVDFNVQITNLMGMNLDMSPIEVRIENRLYREGI